MEPLSLFLICKRGARNNFHDGDDDDQPSLGAKRRKLRHMKCAKFGPHALAWVWVGFQLLEFID